MAKEFTILPNISNVSGNVRYFPELSNYPHTFSNQTLYFLQGARYVNKLLEFNRFQDEALQIYQ